MVAEFVVVVIAMVAVFGVALIALGRLSAKWAAEQPNFEASLAKNLPPDIQADMKPRRLGLVTSMAVAVVVLPILLAVQTATGKARAILWMGYWLVIAVACAAWAASIATTWLDRRYRGEVLVDLSPYPLAGAVRRSFWFVWVVCIPMPFSMLFSDISRVFGLAFIGFQTAGEWLVRAVSVAFVLLAFLANLMYSDRVWLAECGLYFGGRLYPLDGVERIAWTDDGRAFALRRRGRWLFMRWILKRWIVVPVPEGLRAAAEEALQQLMPASTPTL